jgi:carbamoyl-phosphate synthase small subunit
LSEQALLALEDGTVFQGRSIGCLGESVGEVVFNTAMTGYQEILTDPSYASQLVALTYPHIGNTGINAEDFESSGVFAAGLIIRDLPQEYSSFRASDSLGSFLEGHGVVGISDIDTRKLTRLLTRTGAQKGCLQAGSINPLGAVQVAREWHGLNGVDLARRVSTKESYRWPPKLMGQVDHGGSWAGSGLRVVAVDFGVKHSILRRFAELECEVMVVSAHTSAEEIQALQPDGVFLSNGPGDPEPCDYAIQMIRTMLAWRVPIFGICLGHQLLALAAGARTEKMKFGHHGANHPVMDLDSGRVFITSQNHGFAVDPDNLPDDIRITHRSLFDDSVQGIELLSRPAFSFQGHPEASPGPHDMSALFDRFVTSMHSSRLSSCA